MFWLKLALCLICGYLLGSVSAAVLITRDKDGNDVRSKGSGNAGATNVARVYGLWVGLATLAGDGVKTAVSMLIGKLLLGFPGIIAAAFACLIGHCFPLYFGFKGGKAVSVSAAIALFLDWRFLIYLLAVFFLTFLFARRVSVCSMVAAVSFPFGMLIFGGIPVFHWYGLALGIFITLFVVFLHRGNIKRLINGTEPEFKLGKR